MLHPGVEVTAGDRLAQTIGALTVENAMLAERVDNLTAQVERLERTLAVLRERTGEEATPCPSA